MSTSDETEKPAKSNAVQSKLVRWASAAVGLIFLITGALQLYHVYVPALPGCTSDTAKTTLIDIYKKKDVALESVTKQQTLTDGSSEKTCQADIATASEAATLFYRIYWQDKAAQIQITKVDTHAR